MRPFYVALTTVVHGLFTEFALIVLADVLSPTFNITRIPELSGSQATVAVVLAVTTAFALGILMHTISRAVFHNQKQQWNLDVVMSDAVRERLAAIGAKHAGPGSPSYAEVEAEEGRAQRIKAAGFMHAIEYQVMIRSPYVFDVIQLYRDQYRMARAFVLPSALLAISLPFWAPVIALDGAGVLGPFPLIRFQTCMLSVLAASVAFWAFRERAYRYAAAKTQAWVALEGLAGEELGRPRVAA